MKNVLDSDRFRLGWYLNLSQCWNAIAVPASRAFAHKRSICAGRSEFKPQWDPTARRLSPLLPVSHMVTLFRPLSCLLTQMNGFENMKWNNFVGRCKKRSEKTELVRDRCRQSTLPRLSIFLFPRLLEVIRTGRIWSSLPATANASSL